MQLFLLMFVFIFILFLAFIFAIPYQFLFVISLLAYLLGRPGIAIFTFVLAVIKVFVRNDMKNNQQKFYYYNFNNRKGNFNYEDFNNQYQGYNNFNQNTNTYSDYQRACEVLGVSENSNYNEKKKRYRDLLKKYHPDINKTKEAEEMSKKINDAWDIIEKYNNS